MLVYEALEQYLESFNLHLKAKEIMQMIEEDKITFDNTLTKELTVEFLQTPVYRIIYSNNPISEVANKVFDILESNGFSVVKFYRNKNIFSLYNISWMVDKTMPFHSIHTASIFVQKHAKVLCTGEVVIDVLEEIPYNQHNVRCYEKLVFEVYEKVYRHDVTGMRSREKHLTPYDRGALRGRYNLTAEVVPDTRVYDLRFEVGRNGQLWRNGTGSNRYTGVIPNLLRYIITLEEVE